MKQLYRISQYYKRMVLFLRYSAISGFGIVVISVLLLQFPAVQNYLAAKVIQRIAHNLQTEINFEHVRLLGMHRIEVNDLYMLDKENDTLFQSHRLQLDFSFWQLFKKNIRIHNIQLATSKLNVYRKDKKSGFNYDFLLQSKVQKTSQSKTSWSIELQDIDLEKTFLSYRDLPGNNNFLIKIPSIRAACNETDIETQKLHLSNLMINRSTVQFIRPAANLLVSLHDDKTTPASPKALILDSGAWDIRIDTIQLNDQSFSYTQYPIKNNIQNTIDFNDLDVQNFNCMLQHFHWLGDSIDVVIKQITAREKSGFKLMNLTGFLHLNAHHAVIDSFYLLTPQSEIKNRIALRFHSLNDFSDIFNKVKFHGNFNHSLIAIKDIKYFAPDIQNEGIQRINLSGELKGKIIDLRGKNIHITYNEQTQFAGNLEVIGLPNIKETFINIEAKDFRTNYKEISALIPGMHLPAEVRKLGKIKFQGQFTGFISDFVAYGTMETALGKLKSDINMKFDKQGIPQYSGNLASNHFQLGQWLDNNYIGSIAFNSKIIGRGFDFERMEMNIDGDIASLELNGYNYHHVKLNGSMKKRFFSGILDVNDRRANFDFKGTIDLSQYEPVFDFKSNITFADLYDLNLSKQALQIKTNATLAFSGIDPDNMNGKIQFTNAFVSSPEGHYNIDTISINSTTNNLGNSLNIQSDIMDLNLDGDYHLTQIPNQVMHVLNTYYNPDSIASNNHQDDVEFNFTLIVKKNYKAFSLLYDGLKGLGGSFVYGHFNSQNRTIRMDGIVPEIQLGKSRKMENANFLVRTYHDTLKLAASFSHFVIDADNRLGKSRIKANIYGNEAHFKLESSNNNIVNDVSLNGDVYRNQDTLNISLSESTIELADKIWEINSDNLFKYYDDGIQFAHFQLNNSGQSIDLSTKGSQKNYTALQLKVHELDCQTLTQLADYKDYSINGVINGNLRLLNVFGKSFRIIQDLQIKNFGIDEQELGILELQGGYIPYIKQTNIIAKLIQKDTLLDINGVITMDEKKDRINLKGHLYELPASALNPFLSGILSDMAGSLSGDFSIGGKTDNVDLAGNILYHNGGVHFDYLNTNYRIDTLHLSLNKQNIRFEPSMLYDMNGISAQVSGNLMLPSFNNLIFNHFEIKTADDFQLMNLDIEDNNDFYGQAYGAAYLDVSGPVDDMNVYVNASTGNNSKLFIPVTYGGEYGDYDFIQFRSDTNDSMVQEKLQKHLNNLHLTMDLDINPKAEVQLIFDLQAGDIIKSRGDGNIKLDINTSGDFNMYGAYTIKNGSYLFTLKDIINKEFLIEEGGTLTWTGDPYEALLDINAIYKIKAAGYDLFASESSQLNENEIKKLKQPTPLDVYLKMRGSLSAPNISFDIRQSDINSYAVSNRFSQKLQEIRSDENELSKQVLGLIVFNKFIPSEVVTNTGSGSNWKSAGVNTMTEFLSSQLSMYFSDMLSKYDMEIDLNYKNYELGDISNTNNSLSRNELNLELSKKLGRFNVNVGGNFDFGNTNSSVTATNNLAGDFEVEYSISEDGKFRIKGFRKSDYDIFENANKNKTGIGLFFRKDFDTAGEFFQLSNGKKTASKNDDKPIIDEISSFPD